MKRFLRSIGIIFIILVVLVVFYLMKEKGWDYNTCIDFIKIKRPSVNPNNGYVIQLKDYYEKYIKK